MVVLRIIDLCPCLDFAIPSKVGHIDQTYVLLHIIPCWKLCFILILHLFMVYLLVILVLFSLLCLRHLCRCPLTITFCLLGFFPSSITKLLPFDYLCPLSIDMLVPLDSLILLFQIVTSENSVSSLNIPVYMSMTFLSSEIPPYFVVKSLSFVFYIPLSWYAHILGVLRTLIFSSMLTFIPQWLFKTFQLTCLWPSLFPKDPWAVILFCTPVVISLLPYNFPQ
jgi:hypothetical protein